MTREKVLALLSRRREALRTHDVVALRAIYTTNARLDSPFAGSVTGVEAILKSTQAFFASFPDAVVHEDPPIIDGNRVAIFAIVAGSEVGEMMGLAAHKQAYQFPVSFLLELDETCVQYARRVYDFTGLLVQIRVLKAKPV